MPSIITEQQLNEMLNDKSLNPQTEKIGYESGYSDVYYHFRTNGKEYIYIKSFFASYVPEFEGKYSIVTVTKLDFTPGDVNNDGEVTLDDAILTLQKAMKVSITAE